MSLDTTTSDPVDLAADATTEATEDNTEAVNNDEDMAESQTTSQTSETEETEPEEAEAETDNSEETELKEWAAKKNLPLDDPLKIAKMYRESEKQLGKKGQKEGQLKAAVTAANTEASVDDVQALRNEISALSFKVEHPEAVELEGAMTDILEEKPWMASDLEGVLEMAKGRSYTDAAALLAARQAGKKEALTQTAKAARASLPKASATNSDYSSNKITMDNVDELIARNGQEWYVKNRDKINAVLTG